jgi:hypothetical protein
LVHRSHPRSKLAIVDISNGNDLDLGVRCKGLDQRQSSATCPHDTYANAFAGHSFRDLCGPDSNYGWSASEAMVFIQKTTTFKAHVHPPLSHVWV